MHFADFNLNKQLLSAIEELGFEAPTPVQAEAIPTVLAGHDVLGIAQTGTGKTAAFGLPLLMKIKYAQGPHPRALVLAPTRELVVQLHDHLSALARHTDLRLVALYGGTGFKAQTEALAAGVDVVVATPGRLMDIYLREVLILKDLKILVIDEADKMMDMGFMPQIRRILEVLPRKRQNLLFSATMSERVVRLSEEFLEFPVRIEVTPSATAAETVTQTRYDTPNLQTKLDTLVHLLADEAQWQRVLVFTRTKETANRVITYLKGKIHGSSRVIHSNKDQNTRLSAMQQFRAGDIRVLVSTDVAARGLDITGVTHVVNFEVPVVYEDYVHRIGRTGRAQQLGEAVTLVDAAEAHHIAQIEALIRQPIAVAALPAAVTVAPTPFAEKQALARAIDQQKRREDPTFRGAFHEKQRPIPQRPTARTGKKPGQQANRSRPAGRTGSGRKRRP